MIKIIGFVNIILAALLAGTSFGIWIGFNPMNYSPSTYVEQQQNLLRSLNTLMIILVFTATLTTIVSAILQRKNKKTFITLLIAAGFFIGCILITRFGNVPIQNNMLTWITNSLPANWAVLRADWWRFHKMRTITELIALCLIVWTSIKNESTIVY
ncbi:MAG: DUF1772 domain-containing protein [Ginsengibacter sp.]